MVLVASLLANTENIELPGSMIKDVISSAINEVIFGSFFPRPFIVSAERTGAVIFSLHHSVRRDKAPFLSGCESRPATVAPAGSSRSGRWR